MDKPVNFLGAILALFLVLALIVMTLLFVKWISNVKFFSQLFTQYNNRASLTKTRRLAVIETLSIDPRRRLLLVRRDNVEHLIMVGATTETILETVVKDGSEISQ